MDLTGSLWELTHWLHSFGPHPPTTSKKKFSQKHFLKNIFFKAFATGKWNKKLVWVLDFFHFWKSQKNNARNYSNFTNCTDLGPPDFFLVLWAFCFKLGRHIADSWQNIWQKNSQEELTSFRKYSTAKSEKSMMNPLAPPLCLPPPKYHMKIKKLSKIFFFKAFATGKWNKKVVWLLDFFQLWKSQKKSEMNGSQWGDFRYHTFLTSRFFFHFLRFLPETW